MIVRDIIEYCINKANLGRPGKIDAEVFSFAMKALNSVAEDIWRTYPWVNSKLIGLNITTNTATIALPAYVDYVKAVRIGSSNIENIDEIILSIQDPNLMDGETTLDSSYLKFINLPYAAVLRQPAQNNGIFFRSCSSADAGKIVKISGMDDVDHLKKPQTERITLQGLDSVMVNGNYEEITGISKEPTTGRIYCQDEDGNILATIEPSEDRSLFKQIKIMPFTEGEEQIVQIIAKRKFLPISDEYDVFPIERAEQPIKNFLIAELLEYDQKNEIAATYREKGLAYLQDSMSDETNRQAQDFRLIPRTPLFSEIGAI